MVNSKNNVQSDTNGIYARIYRSVSAIPSGSVATYGQIAKLVGASSARQVGYALSSTPAELSIPWHRVINAQGKVSLRSKGGADGGQLACLSAEGVLADKKGKIDLAHYRWCPDLDTLVALEQDGEQEVSIEAAYDLPGFG